PVKEVGGQADDALEVALADERAADVGLCIAAKQDPVREDARAFTRALQRADNVQEVRIVSLLGRWRTEGLEAIVGVIEWVDADDLRHSATDLGRGVELALALSALSGEVPHEVLVGITEDVVAVSAVL